MQWRVGIPCFTLLFCIVVCVKAAMKCTLPKPQIVQWDKLEGEWFNILNRRTAGDIIVRCMQLRNFHQLKKGFSYTIEDYHLQSGTYEGVKVVFQELKPGVYCTKKKNEIRWAKIVMKDAAHVSAAILNGTVKELKETRGSTAVFYTDYENYLIDFRCAKDGRKMIWIMSRNSHPTGEDILRITNKLAVIGKGWNTFPLYFSGCVTTKYDVTLFEHAR